MWRPPQEYWVSSWFVSFLGLRINPWNNKKVPTPQKGEPAPRILLIALKMQYRLHQPLVLKGKHDTCSHRSYLHTCMNSIAVYTYMHTWGNIFMYIIHNIHISCLCLSICCARQTGAFGHGPWWKPPRPISHRTGMTSFGFHGVGCVGLKSEQHMRCQVLLASYWEQRAQGSVLSMQRRAITPCTADSPDMEAATQCPVPKTQDCAIHRKLSGHCE